MKALHAHGFNLKGIRNGIRAKLETGVDIDIYTLKHDPEQIRARMRLPQENAKEREQVISAVREVLQIGLEDIVKVDPFRCSRQGGGAYHYYAHLNWISAPVSTQETVRPEKSVAPLSVKEDTIPAANEEEDRMVLEVLEANVLKEPEVVIPEEEEIPKAKEVIPKAGKVVPKAREVIPETEIISEAEVLSDAEVISEVEEISDGEVIPEIGGRDEDDTVLEAEIISETDKEESSGQGLEIEKIVELLEPVDAKMFRNGVDLLGLPRSSILRLSLTRIYRSAMDPVELKTAIAQEAEKIVAQSDKDALQEIKEKNKTEFLDPVIHALWGAACGEMTISLE